MQLILTTDGATSFAIFIYEGIDSNTRIEHQVDYQIGFDAGNQRNSTVIKKIGHFPVQRSTSIYRIDG